MNKIDYLALSLGLLLIILIHIFFWRHFFNPDFGADQRLYWNQGLFLYKDFAFINNPAFGLFEPYILCLIYLFITIFGESYIPLISYNIALYCIMVFMIYIFSKKVFAVRIWAIIAFFLMITNHIFIQFNFLIAREMTTVVFLTICCILFYYYFNYRLKSLLVALSVLSALILLNDNRYFPLFMLFILIWGYKEIFINKKILNILFYGIMVMLLLLPWSYRNYKVNGYFMPISEARFADYLRFLPDELTKNFDRQKLDLWAQNAVRAGINGDSSLLNLIYEPNVRGYYRGSNEGYHNIITEDEYNALQEKKAKKWFGKRIEYIVSFWTFCQFKIKIGPGDDDRIYPKWSLIRNINEIIHTGMMLPFFFIGLFNSVRNQKKVILFFAAIVIVHSLMHVIYGHYLIRYRYQVMPLYSLVSVYGILVLFQPLLRKVKIL